MAKFTIKDLAEGRCVIVNNGSVEDLNEVLRAAFPDDTDFYAGNEPYYYGDDGCWIGIRETNLPTQSVNDFMEELKNIKNNKFPKRGDRILVSDDNTNWKEFIFVACIDGAELPIFCVYSDDEYNFKNNQSFRVIGWKYWKPIPKKKILKVTKEEIAAKFGVDEVEIV